MESDIVAMIVVKPLLKYEIYRHISGKTMKMKQSYATSVTIGQLEKIACGCIFSQSMKELNTNVTSARCHSTDKKAWTDT